MVIVSGLITNWADQLRFSCFFEAIAQVDLYFHEIIGEAPVDTGEDLRVLFPHVNGYQAEGVGGFRQYFLVGRISVRGISQYAHSEDDEGRHGIACIVTYNSLVSKGLGSLSIGLQT